MSTVEKALVHVRMVADIVSDLERRLQEAEELLRQAESSLRDAEAEEGRREEGGMGNLELSLMRAHHDLQKTKKIVKEGHQ